MADNTPNPKQIEDPDNEGQMIDNPNFDPKKNEDGTPVEKSDEKDDLAPIKEKLNKAYGERDKLKEERDALQKKIRDAELQKLKDEGKNEEHYQGIISDKDDEIEKLKKQVVELTRDNKLHLELGGYEFRNEKASKSAYNSIVDELVQDEQGSWVHKSGKSIKDFVKSFVEDEDNSFFFKPKENRGTGNPPKQDGKPEGTGGKKLRDMTQAEVLKLAQAGKLKP